MVGVRKLLEFVFTKRELKILDDALPEYKRKEKIEEEDDDSIEEEAMKYKGVSTDRKPIKNLNEMHLSYIVFLIYRILK